jgi:hypothetical protein
MARTSEIALYLRGNAMRQMLVAAFGGGMLFAGLSGCHLSERGPSDQHVIAAVRKSPPLPPTLGPTYLDTIESTEVVERGSYNANGKYWPVRVRVRGTVKVRLTNIFQFGVVGNPRKQTAKPLAFVEEARLAKNDLGDWQVSYNYGLDGPRWRVEDRNKLVGGP